MLMNKELLRIFQNIGNSMSVAKKKAPPTPPVKHDEEGTRIVTFEKRLKEQQDNFNKMIKADIPQEIDFTDKSAVEPMSRNVVDYTMKQRERELAQIMSGQQKNKNAEAWIKGEKNLKPSNNLNIKIDHATTVELEPTHINQPKEERRVTFQIDEIEIPSPDAETNTQNATDLFTKLKLKKEPVELENYQSLFKQIIDSQTEIITQLKLINITLTRIND